MNVTDEQIENLYHTKGNTPKEFGKSVAQAQLKSDAKWMLGWLYENTCVDIAFERRTCIYNAHYNALIAELKKIIRT